MTLSVGKAPSSNSQENSTTTPSPSIDLPVTVTHFTTCNRGLERVTVGDPFETTSCGGHQSGKPEEGNPPAGIVVTESGGSHGTTTTSSSFSANPFNPFSSSIFGNPFLPSSAGTGAASTPACSSNPFLHPGASSPTTSPPLPRKDSSDIRPQTPLTPQLPPSPDSAQGGSIVSSASSSGVSDGLPQSQVCSGCCWHKVKRFRIMV